MPLQSRGFVNQKLGTRSPNDFGFLFKICRGGFWRPDFEEKESNINLTIFATSFVILSHTHTHTHIYI